MLLDFGPLVQMVCVSEKSHRNVSSVKKDGWWKSQIAPLRFLKTIHTSFILIYIYTYLALLSAETQVFA